MMAKTKSPMLYVVACMTLGNDFSQHKDENISLITPYADPRNSSRIQIAP